MTNIPDATYGELLEEARRLSREKKDWHHHYLPPGCALNFSTKHLLVLEGENKAWKVEFEQKPMAELEELENLFFGRTN